MVHGALWNMLDHANMQVHSSNNKVTQVLKM